MTDEDGTYAAEAAAVDGSPGSTDDRASRSSADGASGSQRDGASGSPSVGEPASAADSTSASSVESGSESAHERAPNAVFDALVGAVVGSFLPLPPFSAVVGGAVSGYLRGSDLREGATVGALAGAFVLAGLAILGVPLLVLLVLGVPAEPALGVVLLAVVYGGLFLATSVVGLYTIGGALGAYVRREGLLEGL